MCDVRYYVTCLLLKHASRCAAFCKDSNCSKSSNRSNQLSRIYVCVLRVRTPRVLVLCDTFDVVRVSFVDHAQAERHGIAPRSELNNVHTLYL